MKAVDHLLTIFFILLVANGEDLVVLEYFNNVHTGNFSIARETCKLRGGSLAGDGISIDDWDNHMIAAGLDETVLMDTYFTVYITRQGDGVWRFQDGQPVDMTSSMTLTLREYNTSVTPVPTYNCALWSPWEPFLIPTLCQDDHAFVCRIPVETSRVCGMVETNDTRFNGNWDGDIETLEPVSQETCVTNCILPVNITLGELPCWAAEYRIPQSQCLLMRRQDRPMVVPDTTHTSSRSTFLKSCKTVASFPEDTCTILCKCDTQRTAIVIPQTEDEMQAFKEKVAEETKKELSVPKKNLSSTVRKKTSAKDERQTSTGMGALGITMLSMVFGGLFALDLSSFLWKVRAKLSQR